jgi:wyosine [tRNA(Phe)-imidazoG37] synthetase (radical SAM superfamily)
MFDIDFYMKSHKTLDFESIRNPEPIVYNIETTNACNMSCKMCPRTTMMTRPIVTMEPALFEKIVDQLKPHTKEKWDEWERFVWETYGIPKHSMSENHFFLYVIPKVIQLHGYGEPLLDKNMPSYVKMLTDRGLESYFSCNPANIDLYKTIEMFQNGLSYIKYSIESTDLDQHKSIRGDKAGFELGNIWEVIRVKRTLGYETIVVITMLDLNRNNQAEEYEKLKNCFAGHDVYIYFKSQDTQWLNDEYHDTASIHWTEVCRHPWMSMTIKSNGEACQCMEDFNNAIVLGDANQESLYDIWNGERYAKLRYDHFNITGGIQCTERCDMNLVGEL